MSQRKHIFICGLHRSGTSILYKIIGSSPKVSKHSNTNAPEDEGQHLQSVYPPAHKFGGAGNFAMSPSYHYTNKHPLLTPKNKVKIIRAWEKHWDLSKSILMEKSPPNIIHTRFLQELVDISYFVVIIRHPLAVAGATKRWNKQSLEKHLIHWIQAHSLLYKDMPKLKKVLVIHYENFCKNPKKNMLRLESLLGEKLLISKKEYKQLKNSNKKYATKVPPFLVKKYEKIINKYGYSLLRM